MISKIKFTKGELKKQRDALSQYRRYLPILTLKKQQLQLELSRQSVVLEEKRQRRGQMIHSAYAWAGLLSDKEIDIHPGLKLKPARLSIRNVAGIDLPVFEGVEFEGWEYDLFLAPLWVDRAVESLRQIVSLQEEIRVMEEGIGILVRELRIASQRVNLFEKLKIPEAQENIRLIKIYLGDEMANAVGRAKIAKSKREEAVLA